VNIVQPVLELRGGTKEQERDRQIAMCNAIQRGEMQIARQWVNYPHLTVLEAKINDLPCSIADRTALIS